ncbi:hypothetical protein ACSBM8_04820 [Sphingomonas sp. ASY06-1R]|uniref:hypothetical protein n=1 Tax=Sphingomonas sp. ASY06-1R TaxID=3445771 RepID=UPI003FA2E53C
MIAVDQEHRGLDPMELGRGQAGFDSHIRDAPIEVVKRAPTVRTVKALKAGLSQDRFQAGLSVFGAKAKMPRKAAHLTAVALNRNIHSARTAMRPPFWDGMSVMLDEKLESYLAVLVALRDWHKDADSVLPPETGITYVDGDHSRLSIPYGIKDVEKGRFQMKRGNFQVTHFTDDDGDWREFPYQHHWPKGGVGKDNLKAALAETDLSGTTDEQKGQRTLLITVTSEAARSQLVGKYVRIMYKPGISKAGELTPAFELVTKNYDKIAQRAGRSIQAGAAWKPVTIKETADFISTKPSPYDRDIFDKLSDHVGRYGPKPKT